VSKLKIEAGENAVAKIVNMFKDITVSEEM